MAAIMAGLDPFCIIRLKVMDLRASGYLSLGDSFSLPPCEDILARKIEHGTLAGCSWCIAQAGIQALTLRQHCFFPTLF